LLYARRSNSDNPHVLLLLGASAVVAALVLGAGIGAISGQFFSALGAVLVATVWCCIPALLLAKPLSSRPAIRWLVLLVLLVLLATSAVTLATNWISESQMNASPTALLSTFDNMS
jgi:hypothetical protein